MHKQDQAPSSSDISIVKELTSLLSKFVKWLQKL